MSGNSRSLVSAVRGPVMLITLGGLFALNNFTPYGFGTTWPVLLIVFGLLTLAARGTSPAVPPGYPPRPAPPPYAPPPPGGYRQSPYTQPPPPAEPPAPAGTAKGGFGSSAPPRSSEAPPSPTGGES